MRKVLCLIVLLVVLWLPSHASAQRKAGLTVYAVPRLAAEAKKDPMWGFIVSHDALLGQKERPRFQGPQEVLNYFYSLPAAVQKTGVWLVFVYPMSEYSDQEKIKLEKFKNMFAGRKIPLTLCGGHTFKDWRLVEGLDPWVTP